MYSVNLTCAQCGAQITELPFEPKGDRPVYCRDCNRTYRQTRTGGGGGGSIGGGGRPMRQMFDVDLTCAQCGTKITQLPFLPSGDKPVYCRACLAARRAGGDN